MNPGLKNHNTDAVVAQHQKLAEQERTEKRIRRQASQHQATTAVIDLDESESAPPEKQDQRKSHTEEIEPTEKRTLYKPSEW